MQFNKVLNECGISSSNIAGVENPHIIDWASGNGNQTDLGKIAMKKKNKKIIKRKMSNIISKI